MKDSADLFTEAGFAIGAWVRRKADSESGCVVAVQNGKVVLKQPDKTVSVSLDGFLQGLWATFTPKAEPRVLSDVSVYAPALYPEYRVSFC